MTQRSISAQNSARAWLGSLVLLLGCATGCFEAHDATTVGEPAEVGSAEADSIEIDSVQQALDQMFDEPFEPFGTVAPPCTDGEKAAILAVPANDDERTTITCSLTLSPNERITKPLRFNASSSGVVLDCQDQLRTNPNGGVIPASISRNQRDVEMIQIWASYDSSQGLPSKNPVTGLYEANRTENITIRNCSVDGQVKISGLRGAGDHLTVSSHDFRCPGEPPSSTRRCLDHVRRVRHFSPTNILFDNVKLIGRGSTPLYVHPGVTRFTMINSVLDGSSGDDVGMYLDTESTENTILNSRFSVKSRKKARAHAREQLAVDASSYNFMVGNQVSGLDDGGFMLYRNCGEHGTIRYSTPSYNVIYGNHFNYRSYWQPLLGRGRYAVELSSRNGSYTVWNYYCDHDTFPPNGTQWEIFPTNDDSSATTNDDRAHDNIVTSNEFLNRRPKDYMRSGTSLFNFTAGNREVRAFSYENKACWAPWTFGRVLLHGNTDFVRGTFDGINICFGYTCNDGVLEAEPEQICPDPGRPIQFECRAEQDNNGCYNFLSCPVGQNVASVKAACNLELGTVSDAELASVPAGSARVVRQSDKVSDGACYLLDANISSGSKAVNVRPNVRTVNIGCREKDSTGGDCHIRAEFTCQ